MGNGVYFKMIGCCSPNPDLHKPDICVEKIKEQNNQYIYYKNNHLIKNNTNLNNVETQNKNENKITPTKSKHSSGNSSVGKVKQMFIGENSSSNIFNNISICNNTFQMNNSNVFKNNFISNNISNNNPYVNPINDLRHKSSINNFSKYNSNLKDNILEIKTKLILNGDLFTNKRIEIDKYGMKNGLRQRHDGLTIFGIKDNNEKNNFHNCDYYFNFEKLDENNNMKITGKVFEIYVNKKDKKYTLYFLHNSLILYYKINNQIFFDLDKNYYLILGDIFLTIHVKKNSTLNEKIIFIQTEVENEKPKKHSFSPKDTPIKIGRVNCNINIQNPSISKLHSMIDFIDDIFYYKDCGSTNGSTLLIREDDSLKLNGDMNFKLEDISFTIKEVIDDNYIIDENK